ncbi:MAG: AAA family ATPase [Crocinitomicaceae bacterium]|nr:AAA family ATPase [Crocinitomicaceae bacterium]
MKYKKFVIKNYKGITDEIVINLEKNSLIPIIGINESGKTTILQAIFAFDKVNDHLNNGSHLRDTKNLYSVKGKAPKVTAIIHIVQEEYDKILKSMISNQHFSEHKFHLEKYKDFQIENKTLEITRNFHTSGYEILDEFFNDRRLNNILSYQIVKKMPYIFYFDDFRDSIDDTIKIEKTEDGTVPSWLSIIEELFKQTDDGYSVFDLKNHEDRAKRTVLSKVKKKLNKTLTKEWQNFRLDEVDALNIDIRHIEEGGNEYIKLEVIETDSNDDEHFFYIRDRSKGFYWFFNFVMKLEFNPKSIGPEENNSIYLLDEPGSYLHASAQSKLAKKLRQLSKANKVIYCTHSHYLLNPDIIPISSIRIAEKNKDGQVRLLSINDYKGDIRDRKSAFQPILDSLQINPMIIDLSEDQILITEGIYDYYCFELFKGNNTFKVLPGVGADSLRFYISFMILGQKDYRVLWDNDDEGRKAKKKATDFFGELEAENFSLLSKNKGNTILQDMFDGGELKMLKDELGITTKTSFEKVILALYFYEKKDEIISKMPKSQLNFEEIFKELDFSEK